MKTCTVFTSLADCCISLQIMPECYFLWIAWAQQCPTGSIFKVVSAMALIWQTQTMLILSNQTISYCFYSADLGIKQMDSTV